MKESKISIEKLEDTLLEKVSGGNAWDVVFPVAFTATICGLPISLGCSVGSTVCQYRAKKRREEGNMARAEKLETAGTVFTGLAVTGAGVSAVGVGTLLGRHLYVRSHRRRPLN